MEQLEAAEGEAAAKPRVDPRYYAEGATWEHDLARRNRNSRALAWIVAAVMTVVAVASLGTLALLVPLKTYEPYMVVVDKTTGFVEVKRPIAEGPLTQDEAVTTFNVVRYVKARETYDPKALKDNFDLAQLLASGEAARELAEIYAPANPRNPIKLYGTATDVSVSVKSVTFPNNRTALVRFSTDEKGPTSLTTRNWVSLVRFRYTAAPMRNEYRFDNPLGFQVLEYRRDQETAPSPGTVGGPRS